MKRFNAVIGLVVLWALIFVSSFIFPRFIEPTGDGFTRGLNRLEALMIWQAVAFCLAILIAFLAFGRLRSRPILRWMGYGPVIVHLLSVIFVVGGTIFLNVRKPDPAPYTGPTTKPVAAVAPQAVALQTLEPAISTVPEVSEYQGIYRSGFEMSHFYTMDGRGPWWLEADGAVQEKLQSFYVDAPGRGGGITVAMTMQGYLIDAGSELSAIGSLEKKIQLVSIDSIRALDTKEFEMVLQAVQRQNK